MAEIRVNSLTSTFRLLVAGACFLFVLLAGAAAYTNSAGLDARQILLDEGNPTGSRLAKASEIEQLLGRGGFTGQLMSYAASNDPAGLGTMQEILNTASTAADEFLTLGTSPSAYQYLQTARGRIAQGRIAHASLETGVRTPEIVAMEFAGDMAMFDEAYDHYQQAEQRLEVSGALEILSLQRWITSLALAAAVFVMGAGAILFQLNVRRPMRALAENLEELLMDDEGRTLREVERPDEIGDLARIAEQLRRSQLQAGRLLTLGPDGTMRLRLEGENARSVDDALTELSTAAGTARATALSLTTSGKELAQTGEDAAERIDKALAQTVEQAKGQLSNLTRAGNDVLELAGNLEETRGAMLETETEFRGEVSNWRVDFAELSKTLEENMAALASTTHSDMSSLAGNMRDELDTLHHTASRLGEMTEVIGERVDRTGKHVGEIGANIAEVTRDWKEDQTALNKASLTARENLTARLVTLDAQITNLDETLENLDEIATRSAAPIETAAYSLTGAVEKINLAGDGAGAAIGVLRDEADASRHAREAMFKEIDRDKAFWEKTRGDIHLEAGTTIEKLGEAANRMEGLAKELHDAGDDLPSNFEILNNNLVGVSGQISNLEQSGGALANQLSGRLASMHDMLDETRVSFDDARNTMVDEVDTITGVTSDLQELHMNFETEGKRIDEQVTSVADTIESLDSHLLDINQRIATPIDLTPILDALKDEVGQVRSELSDTVAEQGLQTEQAINLGIKEVSTELADLSEAQAKGADFEELAQSLKNSLEENNIAQRQTISSALADSDLKQADVLGAALKEGAAKQRQVLTAVLDESEARQVKAIAGELEEAGLRQQNAIVATLNDDNKIQLEALAANLEASGARQRAVIASALDEANVAQQESAIRRQDALIAHLQQADEAGRQALASQIEEAGTIHLGAIASITNEMEKSGARQQEVLTSGLDQVTERQGKMFSENISGLANRFDNAIQASQKNQSDVVTEKLMELTSQLRDLIAANAQQQQQSLDAGLTNLTSSIGDTVTENSEDQLQLVATGLAELSTTLNGKIAAQSEAAQELAETLCLLDDRLAEMSENQTETQATVRQVIDAVPSPNEIASLVEPRFDTLEAITQQVLQQNASAADTAIGPDDIVSLINPRIETLNETAQGLGEELRSLAYDFAHRDDAMPPQVLDQIARVENLQGGLGDAQQAIALALHDGLKGIAQRLKGSDITAVSNQLGTLTTSLVRQQDRLSETMADMSNDMGARIDDLAGEIARGNRQARAPQIRAALPAAKASITDKAMSARKTAASSRTPQSDAPSAPLAQAPKDNDLSAIYDALRGLTAELKGIAPEEAADKAIKNRTNEALPPAKEEDKKVG